MEGRDDYEVPAHLLQALEAQLTAEMIERLTAYAIAKHKRLRWQGTYGGGMPEGVEAGDLVQEAVEKVLDGRRRWDPEKAPDLFNYLTSVIDSQVSSLVMSAGNRLLRRESALGGGTHAGDEQPQGFFDRMPSETPNPEERMAEEEADKLFWDIHADLCDEPLLQQILECVFDGLLKPAGMAERLGVTTKEINNAKKKLGRRVEKVRAARHVARPPAASKRGDPR